MKHIFTICLALLAAFDSFSQDYLITRPGDTIHGRIVRLSSGYIYFIPVRSDTAVLDSARLEEISSYHSSSGINELLQPGKNKPEPFQRWEFAVLPGMGYLLSRDPNMEPSDFQQYLFQSHLGFAANGDACWFFRPHWGAGLHGSWFYSHSETEISGVLTDSSFYQGTLKNHLGLTYLAGGITYRNVSKSALRSYELCLAAGYMNYRDKVILTSESFLFTSGCFGASGSVYIDFFLKKTAGIRTGLVFTYATMEAFPQESRGSAQPDLFPEERVNLSRMDVVLGVRF